MLIKKKQTRCPDGLFFSARAEARYHRHARALKEVLKSFAYLEPKKVIDKDQVATSPSGNLFALPAETQQDRRWLLSCFTPSATLHYDGTS